MGAMSAKVWAVIGVLLVAGAAQPAAAFLGCSPPMRPYCIDNNYTFQSDGGFSSCRTEVQIYVRAVDRYVDCLYREQKDALEESNRVVDRFNCKARGGSFC